MDRNDTLSFRVADRIALELGYATIRLCNNASLATAFVVFFVMRMGLHWCIYVRDPLKRRSRGG